MRLDPLFTGGPPHHDDSDGLHHDYDGHNDDHDDNDFHSIRLVEFVYHPGRPGGELMLKNIQTVRLGFMIYDEDDNNDNNDDPHGEEHPDGQV